MLVGVGRADPVPEMEGLRLPVTEAPVDKVAVVVLLGVKVGEAVTLEEGVAAPEFVVDMVALVVVVIVSPVDVFPPWHLLHLMVEAAAEGVRWV